LDALYFFLLALAKTFYIILDKDGKGGILVFFLMLEEIISAFTHSL
jgi:hypothetical protein